MIQKPILTENQKSFILSARQTIQSIITGKDERKQLLIIGPCSIHNVDEALTYAQNLVQLQEKVKNSFFIVMRVYIEKPRTALGWRGFLFDPHLDESFAIEEGITQTQKLFSDITDLHIPIAVEVLTPQLVPYYSEYVSWASIGARTIESQVHRELASSLPFPVGLKNATSGDIQAAINAQKASQVSHIVTDIDEQNHCIFTKTQGNPCPHIILRGGKNPNYDDGSIAQAYLAQQPLTHKVIVDCSHANSQKDYIKQLPILKEVYQSPKISYVAGFMIESYINSGAQKLPPQEYGVSVTDPCIGWEETVECIEELCQEKK
ncbi:MAG: 3-deoxy-7-phosphoheptulonate synthase [Candidatus Woesearchaeota archaeon]